MTLPFSISGPVLALMAFIAVSSILLGIVLIFDYLRRRNLTPEKVLAREIALAEADAVAQLTGKKQGNSLDLWLKNLLESGGSNMSPLVAVMFLSGSMLLCGGVAFILADNPFIGIGGAIIGIVIPLTVWFIQREFRLARITAALPDALEAVGDGLRSGLTLEQVVEMVGQQVEGPLGHEFKYASRQLGLGQPPMMVTDRMAQRIPVPEFRIFTTAILVHRQTGGNLAMLAERLARASRDRAEFRSHVMAVSAGSRLSIFGLFIVTILAMLFLSGLNYEYVRGFIMNPYGPYLIGTAVTLILVGSLWAWRVMKVRY